MPDKCVFCDGDGVVPREEIARSAAHVSVLCAECGGTGEDYERYWAALREEIRASNAKEIRITSWSGNTYINITSCLESRGRVKCT